MDITEAKSTVLKKYPHAKVKWWTRNGQKTCCAIIAVTDISFMPVNIGYSQKTEELAWISAHNEVSSPSTQ